MVIDNGAGNDNPSLPDEPAIWDSLPGLMLAAAVIGAVIAGAIVWLVMRSDTPATNSAEAGFARDMAEHHAQAVEMALVIHDTTGNEDIRILATDIILTQQAQIGIMRGWLEVWDLPLNSADPPMAWADMSGHDMHPANGLMVGMATADELRALRGMSGSAADREFLRLMIAHHQGGVLMAQAALDASDNDIVTRFAGAIAASQQAEIDLMEGLLAQIQ